MSQLRSAFVAAVLVSLSIPASAQHSSGISTFGREFYAPLIMNPKTCVPCGAYVTASILVCAPNGSRVEISYFDAKNGGKEVNGGTYYLEALSSKQIPINRSFATPEHSKGEVAEYRAIHLHASNPISAYLYVQGPDNYAMTRLLPIGVWDKQYVIASLPSSDGTGASSYAPFAASSLFAVVSIADSTRVIVTPNGTTLTGRRGVRFGNNADGTLHPDTVLMQRGQVYYMKSDTSDDADDESGSIVTANKPIAVWSGHECALNGLSSSYSNHVEQRNLLMQQLVPVLYWRTSDYVSVPLPESVNTPVGDELGGDKLRVYTFEDDNNFTIRSSGVSSASADRFSWAERENITNGLNISSSSAKPIMPVLYDYRNQVAPEPYPTPSMMVLSSWKNRATRQMILSTPPAKFTNDMFRYLTVIAPTSTLSKIRVYVDGVGPKPVTSLLAVGTSVEIPGMLSVVGRTFEIANGSTYYLSSDSGFLAYFSGNDALSTSWNLNGHNPDNFYGEFTTPLNELFSTEGGVAPIVSVTQECSSWTIRARSRDSLGIATIDILNDPRGVQFKRTSDSGYVSSNVGFTPQNATVFPGDTAPTMTMKVFDPLKSAEAFVWVLSRSGYDTLVHLTYRPPLGATNTDTLNFLGTPIHHTSCSHITFYNRGTLPSDTIRVYNLSHRDTTNFIVSTTKQLPLLLMPGDSLPIAYCFKSETPARVFIDSLTIDYGCGVRYVSAIGSATFSKIFATDYDFGRVQTGAAKIHSVRITNTGTSELTIKGFQISDPNSKFTFDDTTSLPFTLSVGGHLDLSFRYAPSEPALDSVRITWLTDAFMADKGFSWLWGTAVQPDLQWTATAYHFGTWNRQQDTVWLKNGGSPVTGMEVFIDNITLGGPDSADYSVLSNQLGYDPLHNFVLGPADSIWILIGFHPDTSQNTARRTASIVATQGTEQPITAQLIGDIGLASVAEAAPAGAAITFTTEGILAKVNGVARLEIFDILGRCVYRSAFSGEASVRALAPGSYCVRITSGAQHLTRMVQVE